MRETEGKFSALFAKSVIYQDVCALYKDELSRPFVAADNVVAFARRFVSFIHTFLVGELIRSRGREKRVEAKRMHVSIAWTGWLRGSQICFSTARVSAPICSALERRCVREKKKARERRAFLLLLFLQKRENSRLQTGISPREMIYYI